MVLADCDSDVENESLAVHEMNLIVDLEVRAFADPDCHLLLHFPFALAAGSEVFVASDDYTWEDFSLHFDVPAPFSVQVVIWDRMMLCAQALHNCDKQVDA